MGVGAGFYMYDVVIKKFTFAISFPDECLVLYLSFGQGSSLLWTHTLRPFIAGPYCANPGREEFSVNDVCKCMRDCRVGWAE